MPMNKNLVTKADTAETAAIEKLEADLPADASDEVKKDISDLKAKAAAHTTKVNGYMKNVEGIVGTINTNLTTTTTDAAGDPEGLQSAITMFTDNLTIIDNELSHPEISGHPGYADAVQQLYDGTNQLVANNDQLLSGTGKISDGSGTLTNGLEDGYKQVTAAKLTKLTAKMFASPTTLSQSRLTTVPNYGAALAPFVLAMALFIGISVQNFMCIKFSFIDESFGLACNRIISNFKHD